MIKEADRYARVCAQIDWLADRAEKGFEKFVQLSVAIVGGFIWLKMQPNAAQVATTLALVHWLMPLLSLVTASQIISDYVSWHGFRAAEAGLIEREDLAPRFPKSGRLQFLRVAVNLLVGKAGLVWVR